MKRGMELIRKILLSAEASEYQGGEPYERYWAQTVDEAYQIFLMVDADLVEADTERTNTIPTGASIIRLTWAGHDFLDASRDNKIWKLAMEKVIRPGASFTFSLLVDWLKQEAQRRLLGTPTMP